MTSEEVFVNHQVVIRSVDGKQYTYLTPLNGCISISVKAADTGMSLFESTISSQAAYELSTHLEDLALRSGYVPKEAYLSVDGRGNPYSA